MSCRRLYSINRKRNVACRPDLECCTPIIWNCIIVNYAQFQSPSVSERKCKWRSEGYRMGRKDSFLFFRLPPQRGFYLTTGFPLYSSPEQLKSPALSLLHRILGGERTRQLSVANHQYILFCECVYSALILDSTSRSTGQMSFEFQVGITF